MKVLYFLESFGLGGIESFVLNVLEHADQSQAELSCCACRMTTHAFDGRIAALDVPFYDLGNDYAGFPGFRYKKGVELLADFLRGKDYDVVHIHANHGVDYLWAKVAKSTGVSKVVIHSHNTGVTRGGYKVLGHKLFRLMYSRYVDSNFACSTEAAEWLCPKSVFKSGSYRVVSNGIVLDEYRFNERARKLKRAELDLDGKFVCGHVGRFNYQKNHEFLLRAFARIHAGNQDSVLVLVGEGELLDATKAQAEDLGLGSCVLFLGPRNDVNELLSAFDVLLFPSRFEGLSVVLVEAQAAGLPILAADTISPDTILSGCIKTVPLDEEEWRSAFVKLRNSYSRKSELDPRLLRFDVSQSIADMDEGYAALGVMGR
jgi:glycosyltransferase involved in cell wall biosynthesis